MVKPLSFKGDKKPAKKRKRAPGDPSTSVVTASTASASASAADIDDDTWVSADALPDVVGPVMLVLPSAPTTCLACDANGAVFADAVENMVDGNPGSAEPHDVRQVWVASRIAGMEERWRFKGRHGKHLSCDKYGALTATSEAVSPLETWTLVSTPDTPGTFQLQTQRDTYISVSSPEPPQNPAATTGSQKEKIDVRGDATESALETTIRIRMQARFKPQLKASKEEKAKEKVSRRELEDAVGRRLEEDEVRMLKKARREGDYHERLLGLKCKSKHDKYS